MTNIFERLPIGGENAIPAIALSKQLGCRDLREMRYLIKAEREDGKLILSDHRGYFRHANRSELESYYYKMNARSMGTLRHIKHVFAELHRMEGQEVLKL